MNDYDFKTLNDKEFEVLATDLLSKRDGVKYERFKPGRDGGVDGRYFAKNGKEVILQCKHWVSSPLEKLIKKISEEEIIKVRKLNPEKYILVLSHSLSRNDKNVIQKVLAPYIKSPDDILGKEDLNDILSSNEDIERRHYKLWIASSNVLVTLLNKPIHDRSKSLLDDIRSNAHIYVPTENHEDALEKLEALGTVIITGPAGIGKTTLAEQLLFHYSALGYSLHCISEEIKEAEAVFSPEVKQIFFFDDFLGRNYLEALSGHEGSHIVNFIKRIKKDENKKFVLTSRTTILNQGKILNDVFHNNNIQRNEFEISFESFSDLDKAKILYNHIWHSSLADDYVDQLYINKRYKDIINHKNYNPRIIKFITDSERLVGCSAENYWMYSKSLLDNPADVWSNPFEAQHDDFGRVLVLLVTLNSRAIEQAELAEAFSRFLSLPYASAMHGKRDYLQLLKHLVGSMLNRTLNENNSSEINLFNPSIGDFVLRRYSHDIPALRSAFLSLRSTASLKTAIDLQKNDLISSDVKNDILFSIINHAKSINYVGYDAEYISLVICTYYNNLKKSEEINILESASKFIIESLCPRNLKNSLKLVEWRLIKRISSEKEVYDYLMRCLKVGVNFDEAEVISDIIARLSVDYSSEANTYFEAAVSEYFCGNVHEEFSDSDVFNGGSFVSIDWAKDNLADLIRNKFMEINIDVSDGHIDEIIDSFDVNNRAEDYFSNDEDYFFDKDERSVEVRLDEIDDLFDRS